MASSSRYTSVWQSTSELMIDAHYLIPHWQASFLLLKKRNYKVERDNSADDFTLQTHDDIRITKSSAAIYFRTDPNTEMTLGAAKALNVVTYLIQRRAHSAGLSPDAYNRKLGEGIVELDCSSSEFMMLIGCNSKNHDYLKSMVQEAGTMRYKWDNNQSNESMSAGFINAFIKGEVVNGRVRFELPPKTRRMLLTETPVAAINFIALHEKIQSKYGMALNDLIEERTFEERKATLTFTIDDENLRKALKIRATEVDGLIKYSYPFPTDLKRKVIDRAVNDYNNANLDFQILDDYGYKKVRGTIFWTFTVISRPESERRKLALEFTDELIAANIAMTEFHLPESTRAEIISSIADEYELNYVLFCIQQTKSAKDAKNKGGYFTTCYRNNRDAFASVWEVRKLNRIKEQADRAEQHMQFISLQKENFKKQFKKSYIAEIAEIYNKDRKLPSGFETAVREFCLPKGRTLNADVFLQSVENKGDIDFNSPVFAAFISTWIAEHCQEDMNHYVESQTIQIPDL